MAYKWIALSNTTVGVLLATINQSIVIISLPAIFRGVGLPGTLGSGLQAAGVPADAAQQAANLPPVGSVFAAFLGVNPVQQLLGPDVVGRLPAGKAAEITGQSFFPGLISGPFHSGLVVVFTAAIVMSVVAAAVSWARGNRYVHADEVPQERVVAAAR